MKSILLIFVLFGLLTSCNDSKAKTIKQIQTKKIEKEHKVIHDTVVSDEEMKIWDTIFKLPEVISQIKYIDKATNGKRRLHVWTYKKPDNLENFYWIKVSEDNGSTTVAHFNFFVYPNNEIKYFDTVNDSILSLEDWRKK